MRKEIKLRKIENAGLAMEFIPQNVYNDPKCCRDAFCLALCLLVLVAEGFEELFQFGYQIIHEVETGMHLT